jgi:DNA-binding protein HU-beta
MKKELTSALVEEHGITKKVAGEMADTVISAIKEEILGSGGITIEGLGKFIVKEREARPGRNPQTGEALTIAARKVLSFSAFPSFKGKLNE